jgi:hypothetical protein
MHFPIPDFWAFLNFGLGLVATFGLVAVIAAAIFAPEGLLLFGKAAVAILRKLLQTRLGVAILVGVACLICGELAGDYHGRSVADAACKAAQERADAEAVARDNEQSALAKQDESKRQTALNNPATREKINEYEAGISPDSDGLSDDDLRGLRGIQGEAGNAKAGGAPSGAPVVHGAGGRSAVRAFHQGDKTRIALAEVTGTLRSCNERLTQSRGWYIGVRNRFAAARLK